MAGAPPILKARVTPAMRRQERQKSRAAAYRAAPHHYAPPVYRPATVGGRPAPAPRPYVLPRGFQTEAATQSTGMRRAARYKRTAAYRQAIRQTYTKQPLAARRQQAKRILALPPAKRTAEQKVILQAHRGRQRADIAARKRYGQLPRVALRSARAQEAYFVSQGKAVAKVAKQQRVAQLAKSPDVIFSTDPKVLHAAGFRGPGLGEQLAEAPLQAAAHVPKDIEELAITTPTSIVHMGARGATAAAQSIKQGSFKPLEKAASQTAKEMVAPYKEFAKDPVTFATRHPVTSYLMFAPGWKVPGRVAGRVGRAAGVGTLRREAATLPGTSLREARTAHPDIIGGRVPRPGPLNRRVRGGGKVSRAELHRRVDEFYDAGQQHKHNAVASATQEANRRFAKVKPKAERRALMEQHVSGARGGAHQHVERQFAREFGSHWQVHDKTGAIVKPKNPAEGSGVIYATRQDAEKVATAIGRAGHFEPKVIELEGATPGETSGFAVVPREAAQRLNWHKRVGKSPAPGAVTMRVASRQFRRTVLPVSSKWLGGQVGEAALRAAVHGAGPTSYLRASRVLKTIERNYGKSVADQVRARTIGTGQFGATGPAAEFAGRAPTLAQEYAGTGPRLEAAAGKLTETAARPLVRHVRGAYRRYAEFVFNRLNAPIEQVAKTAMLGKSLKTGTLLERHVIGLGETAVADAARGLTNTSAQVELGRAIDRAYGRYSKFSPAARETVLHSTPFVPWFINMGKFLLQVLPQDHPVHAALLADLNQADKQWRKAHRLSLYGTHVPDFMMGAYPVGKKYVQVGRFGPFLPGEYVSGAAGQVFPQFADVLANLKGVDWKGQAIPGGQGRAAANAALTLAETFIPLMSQIDRATGLGQHYVAGKKKKPSVAQGKKLPQAVIDMLNPLKPVGLSQRTRKAPRSSGGFGGSSGGGFGGGF